MNKSSSLSFSSPTPPLLPPPTTLLRSANPINQSFISPAVIPLDYNYQTMSPSSYSQLPYNSTTYQTRSPQQAGGPDVDMDVDEIQYSSLFGDPVPPPPPSEFVGSSQLFRANYAEISSEEEAFGRTVTLSTVHPSQMRLFSDVPYSSSLDRRASAISTQRNFDVLPTNLPRLEPPDIQILPNSSASSSEAPYTPNYTLLTAEDMARRPQPALYETDGTVDLTELTETITISDATGTRKYSEATQRVSNFSEDFKSNVGTFQTNVPLVDVPTIPKTPYTRQFSNESYSSSEWFRPAAHQFPEFSKIPRLRPSSKNVMSIKRDEMPMHHSPVATMINDSNESSSGEDQRRLDTTQTLEYPTVPLDSLTPPARPPNPSPTALRDLRADLLSSPEKEDPSSGRCSVESFDSKYQLQPRASPPPLPTLHPMEKNQLDESPSRIREMSPAIVRDSIATGSDHRVDEPRLHKKASFTIISAKSPQSSRGHSPSLLPQKLVSTQQFTQGQNTAISKPRYQFQRKSHSSTQLKLPNLTPYSQMFSDESPRPSVQFNMTGRRSPSKMPQKGILQHRESLTSSQDTMPPTARGRRLSSLPTSEMTYSQKVKSCETLPIITDPYRTAIPRFNRSHLDISREIPAIPPGPLPRPLKPNPNPTRQQRGLLRIINSGDSLSQIPLRSNWASMDDLTLQNQRRLSLSPLNLKNRRRSSSTSPERRSSTQTASDRRSSNLSTVTTSDFSFRRPSVTPQTQRRKSIIPHSTNTTTTPRKQSTLTIGNRTPRSKIAKPSTLSPIIGTPNKDSSSPQSPVRGVGSIQAPSESLSETGSLRQSLSKIPVLSRANSRPNSRLNSRANSPLKELSSELLSELTSRINHSGSQSRATSRTESQPVSRANSRAPSRSTSRASTRPISRGPSRSNSRPSSRMDQAKQSGTSSRSNSRIGVQTTIKSTDDITARLGRLRSTTQTSRKSISLSPATNRSSSSLSRRHSLSPGSKKRKSEGSQRKQQPNQRRDSISRIPLSAKTTLRSGTNPIPRKAEPVKSPRALKKPSPTAKSVPQRKDPLSAKKAPTSVRKTESSVRRTPSSVGKQSAVATKKQPSNLQRTGSNLKRESSNLHKPPGVVAAAKPKREASQLNSKKPLAAVSDVRKTPAVKGSIKNNTAKGAAGRKVTAKNGSDSSTKHNDVPAGVGATDTPTKSVADTPVKAGGTAVSGLKRQVTNVSLKRMGSTLSLLNKKRAEGGVKKAAPDVTHTEGVADPTANGKRIPLTKAKIISITTAAITAQPVQLSAAVKNQLQNVNNTGDLVRSDDVAGLPAAILEQPHKSLESIDKTVTVATDELQKTINENLTDLKSSESDTADYLTDSITSPSSSVKTVVEIKAAGGKEDPTSRSATSEVITAKTSALAEKKSTGDTDGVGSAQTPTQKSPLPPTQPIEAAVSVVNMADARNGSDAITSSLVGSAELAERVSARAISVLPEVDCESANFQKYEFGVDEKTTAGPVGNTNDIQTAEPISGGGDDYKTDSKRRSPDGQGGSAVGSGDNNGSREFLKVNDEEDAAKGCCSCCAKFCMPCRRSRCSNCCRRKPPKVSDESEEPVLSATSSATTTHLEVIDETKTNAEKKSSCWQKLNCCKRCKRKPKEPKIAEEMATAELQKVTAHPPPKPPSPYPPAQSKCGLCLSKVFCCRSVNRVDTTTGDETEVKKCCFCIPCRRKKNAVSHGSSLGSPSPAAWEDPERGISALDASVLEGTSVEAVHKDGCCKRFWGKLLCCRKKPQPKPSESRRASMKAPPPPAEDTRRKLHVDLVEYTSKMKAAIPVLPLYLAWFCAICNTLIPGLGTLLSGFFCVCLGIPRFSQYDSAKARLGSFIINVIVAVSQLFCVLFCFVGWGWSIWWGTIMLKCARKLSKIKKVERLEMEEEKRQAEAAAAAAATATRAALNVDYETTKS